LCGNARSLKKAGVCFLVCLFVWGSDRDNAALKREGELYDSAWEIVEISLDPIDSTMYRDFNNPSENLHIKDVVDCQKDISHLVSPTADLRV
jgi:hypothetical protein